MTDKFTTHKLKNIAELTKNNNKDYIIEYSDDNINTIDVYIKCPEDSVYNFCFLKLRLDISEFPLSPSISY